MLILIRVSNICGVLLARSVQSRNSTDTVGFKVRAVVVDFSFQKDEEKSSSTLSEKQFHLKLPFVQCLRILSGNVDTIQPKR